MVPETVTLLANAKVNLYLEITGILPQGYHEISTVMQSLTLSDKVTVSVAEGDGISLCIIGNDSLPSDCRNIAVKAAKAFFSESGKPFGTDITIEKKIPTEAGLGGGSADAAAVLRALDILSGHAIDEAALMRAAASVGSDVPFCLAGGCRHAGGRGEVLSGRMKPSGLIFLIVKPDAGISTAAAYSALDGLYGGFADRKPSKPPEELTEALRASDRAGTAKNLRNIFEDVLPELCPESYALLKLLKTCSFGAGLCGSGSAVYACFLSEATALTAEKIIKKKYPGYFTAICRGTGHGVRPV